MTTHDERERDRHLDELLPWYVNGTLDQTERDQVEAYLDRCPPARKEVELLRTMRHNLKGTSFPSPPGEFGLARLKREIKVDSRPTPVSPASSPLWKVAAVAACLLAVVQGGILVDLWRGSDVTTAAAPGSADAVIQITFVPSATESDIREALGAAKVTIVSGPSALGIYRLALVEIAEDKEARQKSVAAAMAALIARRDIVAEVAKEGAGAP